jgi:transposase
MNQSFLTEGERKQVELLRRGTRDKLTYMKLTVLIMLDMDKSYDEIVIVLGIGRGTITNCKDKYQSAGLLSYLDRNYVPYTGRLDEAQKAELGAELDARLYSTCQEVCQWIESRFGIIYSVSAVRELLHKLGFAYNLTSEVPGNFNQEEQESFLAQLVPFLAETSENEAVFFTDAVHPQHNTKASRGWIRKGEKRFVPTNSGRSRLNINGAINAHCPEEVTTVEAETINADAVIALYQKLLDKYPDKAYLYVISDNARYNFNENVRDWLTKNPRIVQIFLPPYSPNLNLIERLWKFMRKKVINTKYYPQFKEFRRAIVDFFENIAQYKEELRSLISFNFQRLVKPRIAT